MADDELDVVSVAGSQHGAGLAKVISHAFFTEDALRGVLGSGQDGHGSVGGLGGGDADEVGLLLTQHGFEVGIAGVHVMGIGDVVEGLFVKIAERDEFGGVGVGVGVGMHASDAASDDSCP